MLPAALFGVLIVVSTFGDGESLVIDAAGRRSGCRRVRDLASSERRRRGGRGRRHHRAGARDPRARRPTQSPLDTSTWYASKSSSALVVPVLEQPAHEIEGFVAHVVDLGVGGHGGGVGRQYRRRGPERLVLGPQALDHREEVRRVVSDLLEEPAGTLGAVDVCVDDLDESRDRCREHLAPGVGRVARRHRQRPLEPEDRLVEVVAPDPHGVEDLAVLLPDTHPTI